ncbi:MAG: hypothetical protein AAF921_03230 [Cyanobacteria bacterium P01_D01_bin.44]
MNTLFSTEESVVSWIKSQVNEVCDPCGLAQGLSIGMVDMGLIRDILIQPADAGWDVALAIRFTSAGCFYFPYFEREIRARIETHQQIESLDIKWDNVIDWTPDDLSDAAKSKFKEHNSLLASAVSQQ